jgi:tetratricopeptide (TPR) repeat protein
MKKTGLLGILSILVILSAACSVIGKPSTPTPTVTEMPPTLTPTPSPHDAYHQGNEYLAISDFEQAQEAYNRALDIDPEFGPAYAGLSRVTFLLGMDIQEALSLAKQAVEYSPEDPFVYLVLAEGKAHGYKVEEALEAAEEAVALDEQNASAQAVLAEVLLLNNMYDEAEEALKRAYELDPESARVYASMGAYYQATADFGRALTAYQKAVELEPDFVRWYIVLGDYYAARSKFNRAREAYQEALTLSPDHAPAVLNLAYLEITRKHYDEAEAYIEEAEDILGENKHVYLLKGALELTQQEPDEAYPHFNQALELAPGDFQASLGMGYTYLQQDECNQAETVFVNLGADFVSLEDPRIGRGFAKLCDEDQDKALKYFRDAIELDPYDYEGYLGLGIAYLAQERYEDAGDAYLNALKYSPSKALVHAEFGNWLWSQGYQTKSEKEYQIAQEKNRYELQSYLSLGQMLLEAGDEQRALEEVKDAMEVDENNPQVRKLLGMILYHQGKTKSCITQLEEYIYIKPEDPEARHYLGLAYRDSGNTQQAKTEIETYKQLILSSLSEEEEFQIDFLIDALDVGYRLSEEMAQEELENVFGYFYDRVPEISFEDIENQGRTLVITKHATEEEFRDGVVIDDLYLINQVAAIVVPRINPAIRNGLIVEFKYFGYTQFKGYTTLEDLQRYSDLMIGYEEFLMSIRTELEDYSNQVTSIWSIQEKVQEIRELDPTTQVTMETLTSEELLDMFEESMDEETQLAMERDQEFLFMTGVIPEDFSLEDIWGDMYSEQITGFYIAGEDTLYLIEQEQPSASDEITLAHEYVHALQDQVYNLEELDDQTENSDQSMALDALLEGDATFTASEYVIEHISQVDLADAITKIEKLETPVTDSIPYYFKEAASFPYDFGMEFVAALYEQGGWTAVDEAYSNPPQSTEQIIHPEKYWDGEEPIPVTMPELYPEFSETWEEVTQDVLGELGVQLMLAESLGPAGALQAADGWGGDEYQLFFNEEEETYATMIRVVWDDEDEAEEFLSMYQVAMENRSGFTPVIDDMIREDQVYTWESEEYTICIIQFGRYTTVVIAPDRETTGKMAESVLN